MSASKLSTVVTNIRSAESVASGFASAETLADAGATIPADATRIVVIPDGAVHWHPTGTPTSSFGHAVAANKPFVLEHHQFKSKIIGDGGAATAIVIYLK